ncbi:MAG: arylamine N-acetyltransferase, partial [Actinomycetota bacterium]|nr:arylamine N-acetyltransferase [Actinomycetota bacterium]
QVERVPYETVWLHLGEPWTADAGAALDRIARSGRGGYCYHVNGAFGELLLALGYQVTRHIGGVHGPGGPDPAAMTNHLVLTVAGLPTDDHPSGVWYVDAGLGDGLYEPLPLRAGTVRQGPYRFTLEPAVDGLGSWHLLHDPELGSFTGMNFDMAPAAPDAFDARHRFLATSPESSFARTVTAQLRRADGAEILRGLVLSHVGPSDPSPRVLLERDEWFGVLAERFGLTLDDVDTAAKDRLWVRTLNAHRAWEVSQPRR